MSLLEQYYEDYTLMTKTLTPDGYGGYTTAWKESGTFKAAAVLDSSIEAEIGKVQGVTSVYTITTPKSINLDYHDVIKRNSDNATFRITSDGTDKKTPASASIDMRQVRAESWEIPTE